MTFLSWLWELVSFKRQPPKKATSGLSDLKFLETFDNPFVKVSVFCKVCNKEQSLKYQHTWKRHFLTHAKSDERPHKCPHCPKTFVQSTHLKGHMKNIHKDLVKKEDPPNSFVKMEQYWDLWIFLKVILTDSVVRILLCSSYSSAWLPVTKGQPL